MIKYRLICSDLDDTLITSDGKITDEVKNSINNYINAGGKFCIVTGRMTVGALPVCRELGIKGELGSYQGAVISDIESGEILDEIRISTQDAVEIGKFMEERNFYYQTYVGDVFITRKANDYTVLYASISRAEYVETGAPLSEYIEKNELRPPKLLLLEAPERVPAITAELKEKYGEKFRINTSKPYIIEIIPKGISKAVAVKKIADKYGISREEIICIGDSENDLPMIEYAGLGIAVGNASEEVKARADAVVPSCDESGLAYAIGKYGMEIRKEN